ncbi:unnamed protein product [Protopolystoma xenopodis]|uniref:Uncharacterized protein n=1 Tax=Protopolystoma xenopodis TaxID=117903 RepID=A0A448XCY6_9PLAT|nr:unnamed protein product [Protopolystoma xenopodis]
MRNYESPARQVGGTWFEVGGFWPPSNRLKLSQSPKSKVPPCRTPPIGVFPGNPDYQPTLFAPFTPRRDGLQRDCLHISMGQMGLCPSEYVASSLQKLYAMIYLDR